MEACLSGRDAEGIACGFDGGAGNVFGPIIRSCIEDALCVELRQVSKCGDVCTTAEFTGLLCAVSAGYVYRAHLVPLREFFGCRYADGKSALPCVNDGKVFSRWLAGVSDTLHQP